MPVQQLSRRDADASDALAFAGQSPGVAPGKQPLTAKLGGGGDLVQRKATPDSTSTDAAPKKDASATVSSQDVMYELIAHKMGYQDTIGGTESQLLAEWGYEPQWASRINDAATGFFVGLIKPQAGRSDLTPILVFRGTQEARDALSDIHPVAVGYDQFSANRRFVGQLIAEAGGSVDVTGHSLGGALAQHAAAAFTGSIHRVVTFQAPGIAAGQAREFSEAADKPSVTHHIAGGDLVDTAGDAHLDGEVFQHNVGGGPMSHTKFLLSTDAYAEQRAALGITDERLAAMGIKQETDKKATTHHDKYPHPVANAVDETVRRGVGALLFPILNGVSVLTRKDDGDIRQQVASEGIAGLQGHPVSERAYMVDRLCRGVTGDKDEEAILTILQASAQAGDAVAVIDLVDPLLIARSVDGKQYKALRAFYRQHYYRQTSQDQALKILQGCIDGRTSEWEEEMIADILVERSDGRALITRIGAIYKNGGFSEGLSEIQWQLDGADQRRVDAVFATS